MEKKLYRNEHNKMIGGVCSGLADYLNIDVTIVRLVFLVLFVTHGAGFLMYIILLIAMPKRPFAYQDPNFNPGVDYRVPPFQHFSGMGTPPPFDPNFKVPFQPKKPSNAGMVFGCILIALGSLFLVDELNIIPDWDFDKLWPVLLVVAGIAVIYGGQKKQPWEKEGWNKTVETDVPAADEPTEKGGGIDLNKKSEEPNNDNPTTI
ncbi:PspC domain-containing protein [Mucilaginibacter terrenus]|uniref:PspC domain-containing protein n=1 Tax=Mucilaginibacter terrenus TaxID=2482727 RepID=A0A3E2NQY2_9SPHI|nr:PspC domain-containing protein [Mucilaginibacter terrenus]RFZ83290.1 PspC domain-containing protein [Mucilaginibacter terrenus]